MYICQHPENTRVGANCNSPFHMGEFVIWAKYNVGELQFALPLRAIRPLLYVSNYVIHYILSALADKRKNKE